MFLGSRVVIGGGRFLGSYIYFLLGFLVIGEGVKMVGIFWSWGAYVVGVVGLAGFGEWS